MQAFDGMLSSGYTPYTKAVRSAMVDYRASCHVLMHQHTQDEVWTVWRQQHVNTTCEDINSLQVCCWYAYAADA